MRIDQCLYGYSNGHQLLASSLKLPDEAASLLLVNSDLVGGVRVDDFGYWTGMPVPAARSYALMRTWPAPEMPRPGCVWTHVLLVGFADIARFGDMAALAGIAARPNYLSISAEYGRPIMLDPLSPAVLGTSPISTSDAVQILRSLYSLRPQSFLSERGRPRENALFAIWSQQWPRLRRSFSFQTIGVAGSSPSKFNFRLVADYRITTEDDTDRLSEWERDAVDDLRMPGEFRRFLWRYGSDIRRSRESFRLLADLFDLTRQKIIRGERLINALDAIAHSLPEPDDGRLVKNDIVASDESTFSLFPPVDPLDALEHVLGMSPQHSLPMPNAAAFSEVGNFWPARSTQVLTVVERALTSDSPEAGGIVQKIAMKIDSNTFAVLTEGHPKARSALVAANPLLLDSAGIEHIPQPQLSALIDLLPNNNDLASRVLDRLLLVDDQSVASSFLERFPSLTAARIFDVIAHQISESPRPALPHSWMTIVGPHLKSMLPGEILLRAETSSALAACAILLDLDVRAGLTASPREWATVFARARDDVRGQSRQRLLAYLLAMALARPEPGCELLFERSFEQVHADIAVSNLPYDAFNALARYLPDLYWWEQWDTCLRLRTAVAGAYVDNTLDPESFRRLASNPDLFNKMIELASHTRNGRRFLRQLNGR